ncbi:MAG TPA: putative phage tail protein, partial [Kofleriaceae bacterium]
MPTLPQTLPFSLGLDAPNAYTRMLINLLPPGRLWNLIGSMLYDLFAACADELGRLEGRVEDLFNEADPSTAVELLPDYERELDLTSTGTNADRQARIVARLVARQRYRPV